MNDVKPSARRKARKFALQGLYQWQVAGTEPREIVLQFRADNDMHKVDLPYFQELLENIPRQAAVLDALITPQLDRRFEELDLIERAILRIGAYELQQRIDVPYRVVINEGIELAKTFGATESHKYVNGVLDKLAVALRTAEVEDARASRR